MYVATAMTSLFAFESTIASKKSIIDCRLAVNSYAISAIRPKRFAWNPLNPL